MEIYHLCVWFFFAYLNDCQASLIMQLSFATSLDFYNHFTKFTDLVDMKGKCVYNTFLI